MPLRQTHHHPDLARFLASRAAASPSPQLANKRKGALEYED
jgi:hypothetical protein